MRVVASSRIEGAAEFLSPENEERGDNAVAPILAYRRPASGAERGQFLVGESHTVERRAIKAETLAELGLARTEVLHTAESLFHDHVPAKAYNLSTCWIYRRHAQEGFGATMDPGIRPSTDFRFNSMAELAEVNRQDTTATRST